MRISISLILLSLLCACSGRQQTVGSKTQGQQNRLEAQQRTLIKKAEKAALAGRAKRAKKYLEKARVSSLTGPLKVRSEYVDALIIGLADAGRGVDALTKVIRQTKDKGLARFARGIAFRWAIVSKRCLTARRIKKQLGPLRKSDRRRFTDCQETIEALSVLAELRNKQPKNKAIRKQLRTRLQTATTEALYTCLDMPNLSSIHEKIAAEVATRKDQPGSAERTRLLIKRLPENHPAKNALVQQLHRPQLKVILPLSGPGRLTGRRIKLALEKLYPTQQPIGTVVLPKLTFIDGGTLDLAEKALSVKAASGSFFATIAMLDSAAAGRLMESVRAKAHPTIMITKSDKPARAGGAVWRALHTPLLVARTLAGAAIERNVNDVLVIRRKDDRYGSVHSYWLGKVWKATGRGLIQDRVFDPETTSFVQFINTLKRASFDAIYLPMGGTQAVELMQHLAAQKIWARGQTKRFAASEAMREVYIFGTPEWYSSRAMKRARRYGENAIFPVFYAAETDKGSVLNATLITKTGQPATLIQALVSDLVLALNEANSKSVKDEISPVDAIRATHFQNGSTAGLDFSRSDAVQQLFLMRLTRQGPTLLSVEEDISN